MMRRQRGGAVRTLFLSLFLMLAAALAPAASAQLKPEAMALRDFAAELDRASTAPDFVGFAVAVVHNDQIMLLKTYGVRKAGTTDRITPDTIFRLASVSKGFAAVLAAMEVNDGKFSLTDAIAKTVPQFHLKSPTDTAAVTLEDILSQRTGLPPYAYDNLLESGVPPLDILSRYEEVAPTCHPHDCFAYQNTTYNMIASVIEKVAGTSYVEELHKRILNPLGMRTASFGMAGLKATGNWAVPHVRKKDQWKPTDVKEAYYLLPAAGGMNASITDLAKWLSAQMGARPDVVAPAIVAEVTRPRVSTPTETRRLRVLRMPVTKTQYGLGWRTYTYAGKTLVTHTGSVEGYFSQIAYLPDRKDGIVVLSNSRGSRVTKIMPTWLDYELGLKKTDWFRLGEIGQSSSGPDAAAGDDR